jgi:hypothetical protein
MPGTQELWCFLSAQTVLSVTGWSGWGGGWAEQLSSADSFGGGAGGGLAGGARDMREGVCDNVRTHEL